MKKRFVNYINKRFDKKDLICILTIIATVIYAYWSIWNIFFQQDEWLGIGKAISRSESGGLLSIFREVFSPGSEAVRYLPLVVISNYIVFNIFKTATSYYGLLALVLVTVNSILVYMVSKKVTKSALISVITSLLWMTNSLSYQAITWISPLVPSQLSFLFFCFSLYTLLVNLETKNRKYLFFSILFMLVSLWFKETGVYYVIVFPFYIWLIAKNLKIGSKIKTTALLVLPIIAALVIPQLLLSNNSEIISSVAVNPPSKENIVYNAFLLPARSLYQVYFPYKETYQQIVKAKAIHYSEVEGNVIESLVADAYSLLVAFWFLFIVFLITLIAKPKHKKLILLSLVSFFASTLPFTVFENKIAFVEMRYFIFPALWASLLVSLCVYSVLSRARFARTLLMIIIFLPLMFRNVSIVHKQLEKDIYVGSYRRGILETVSEVEPKLTNKNVFYFFTDHTGFWEFQSGFGQTLGVWLYDSGKIPREVLTDKDFWDSSYEGIKDYQSGKYGYFMTYEKLLQSLKDNKTIDLTNVHSFYWDYQKHTVADVSGEIRIKLESDLGK